MSVCRSRVDEERGTCNIVTIFVRLCVGIIGYQAGIRMQSRTLLGIIYSPESRAALLQARATRT